MSYQERNEYVQQLGYESYADYLASTRWECIRQRIIEDSPCFICSRPADSVHHERYTLKNLMGTSNEYLRPICRGCHNAIEIGADGRKIFDMEEVSSRAEIRRFRLNRHTGIHGPALKRLPPGPNSWQARRLASASMSDRERLKKARADEKIRKGLQESHDKFRSLKA